MSYFFLLVLFRHRYAVGAATKIELNVPNTTPSIIAKLKLIMLPAPPPIMPIRKITNKTRKVDTEVLIVRFNVLFTERLNKSKRS